MFGTGFTKLAKEVGKTSLPRLEEIDFQLRSKCVSLGFLGAVATVVVGFIAGEGEEYVLGSIVIHGLQIFAFYVLSWFATDFPRLARNLIVILAGPFSFAAVFLSGVAISHWSAIAVLFLYPISFGVYTTGQIRSLRSQSEEVVRRDS